VAAQLVASQEELSSMSERVMLIQFNEQGGNICFNIETGKSTALLSRHFIEPDGSLPCSQDFPLVPILSQINPIHTIPSHPLKIRFNIVRLYLHHWNNKYKILISSIFTK
jgi:hypothetical protein